MICQPNCVFTGPDISPFFIENAVFSNSLTIWPWPNQPKSPPLLPEGHCDFACAIASKLPPLAKLSTIALASSSVFK